MFWQASFGRIAGRAAIDGPAGPLWTPTFSQTLGVNNSGWNGFNMRQALNASLISTSGSQVRMTLVASTIGSCTIDGLYIGHQVGGGTDPYDFDGTQVQCLVGGSGSFTIALNTSVVTDPVVYSLDETKNLVIAAHFSATSAIRALGTLSGAVNYNKSAANETSTSNVSSYSTTGGFQLGLVSLIEVA